MNRIGIIICLLVISYGSFGTNYFVDIKSGNNLNSGNSKSAAWQSIERVNSAYFLPGDSILFKRSGSWTGTLKPKGNGAKEKRIVIGAYGKGAAPIINGKGKKEASDLMSAAILLFNQEYWKIRDIEVRNFEVGNPKRPTKKAGIMVLAKDIGTEKPFDPNRIYTF